jgi:hypothetical protein
VREAVGIILCIQAIGGGISAALEGSRSWFAVRYVVPQPWQIPACVVLLVVALAVLWSSRERAGRWW